MGFSDWLREQKDKTTMGIKKFANKSFMEAVAAGCAMIASADGSIDSAEKQKMVGFISASPVLKVFNISEVLAKFDGHAKLFEFDFNVGKLEALKAISKVKKNSDEARTFILVCSLIGASDGNFDEEEKNLVREMCIHLGLNPVDFEL